MAVWSSTFAIAAVTSAGSDTRGISMTSGLGTTAGVGVVDEVAIEICGREGARTTVLEKFPGGGGKPRELSVQSKANRKAQWGERRS